MGIMFPTDISKIVFAGDWHMNPGYAEYAIAWAKSQDAQVILHTGDFGYTFVREFVNAVHEAAEESDLIVMFVDGNHEDFNYLYSLPIDPDGVRRVTDERIWHLPRGFRWEWSGKSFLALGGAVSVDQDYRTPGASWWPEETITFGEAILIAEEGHADIMVTHDAPAGHEIPGLRPDDFAPHLIHASELHRKTLKHVVDEVTPELLVHGHYHIRYSAVNGDTAIEGLGADGSAFYSNMLVKDL
jgi:predicted phosphodiesterase